MKKKSVAFIILVLLSAISSSVYAEPFDLKINVDSVTGIVEGKISLEKALQYEEVTVKVSNEENSIVYLDQIFTNADGEAEFKYIHNNENAGSGMLTVTVAHNGDVLKDTYTVEEKKVIVTHNSVIDKGDGSYEMSYTLNNLSKQPQELFIVTAVYEADGRLKSAEHINKELAIGEKATETEYASAASNEIIKTFFWERETLCPYCEYIVWDKGISEDPVVTEAPKLDFIRIESESGTADFTPQLLSGEGISESLMHLYKKTFNPDIEYNVEYAFDCAEAGIYEFTGIVSEFMGYTAECSLSVNGDEAIHSSSAKKIEDVTIGVNGLSDDLLDKFSFGNVFLNEGKNTLTLNIESKNWQNTSVSFDADYFEFIPVTYKATVASIQKSGLNIFEQKNGMEFNLILNGIADREKEIQYTVTDYFGNECVNSKIVIPKDSYKVAINANLPDTGWYKLSIKDELIEAEENFVVVPNLDERLFNENSTFATDLATSWHVDSHYKQRLYANAAKFAGSDWVRDRFLWREIETSEGIYDFNNLIGDIDALKDEGVKVSNAFHESPSWTRTKGGTLPDNPKIMYDFIKLLSDNLNSYVDVWEIWNEQDAYQFSKEGADKYAAMLKAAVIASDNTKNKPLIALGGLCTNDSEYNKQVFQNGAMKYIDIYNYHTHLTYDPEDGKIPVPQKERMKNYARLSRLYGIENKPVWHTESGIRQFICYGETQLTWEQCVAQVQHIVPAYLEAIATGVDKQFSFIGIPFVEGGADFGLFDKDGAPRPAYAAQAVMTKLLEGMSFYGVVHSLPDGATGYAMHNTSSVCEILWSEKESVVCIEASDNIKVYDIMGREITLNEENGMVELMLSPNPVYVIYSKNDAPENIYVRQMDIDIPSKTALTDADKVVLYADFPVTDFETDKAEGYSLSLSEANAVNITVYNFSDKEMSGTLSAVAENNAFDIIIPDRTITIPAQSERVVTIDVESNDFTAACREYDLKVGGVFNGEDISPLVAHISFDRGIDDYTLLHGSNAIISYKDGWQNPAVTSNLSYEMTSQSEGIQFALNGDGAAGMFYPYVYSRSQDLSAYDGIRMSVYFDKTVNKSANNYMTIQISDGISNFVLDNLKLVPMKEGWNDYSFEWSDFTQRVSGTDESIMDILGKYMYVRIGVHTSQTELTYKLNNVGLFSIEDSAELPEITASYSRDDSGITVNALLPDEASSDNILVYYDGKTVTSYITSGSEVVFKEANPSEGTHTILVVAYTSTGYAIYKEIEI